MAKRCPFAQNKARWEWFQLLKRARTPGLGPFEAIVSHRGFFRAWDPDRIAPMYPPKPIPAPNGWEKREHIRRRGRRADLWRDPRYRKDSF